ncbi:putative short-chain type dehydrogenase/reductase [compost metagenome]|uniref:SDR family NAD(P)-dependent oxidoreductase n=1 Tax=Achromobacter sp. Root83 TaxID=1736602 RepID=UPI00070BC2FA|nr:SDR family NAD(P)-dependent oxidoreductase [Achromobacter sp. Root83]KRC73604.1 3-oxoacyl-ACP reductase [Achromobacter sp. Root83]
MSIRFDDRVAVVTGAGQGLGRSHALQLAARGCRVVVNDFGGAAQAVADEIAAAGGQAIADGGSVCNSADVAAMAGRAMDAWGRIDILINNAGILRDKTFAKMSAEDFNAVVDVHLLGSANCARAVWPVMREQGYGRILMTTSTSGVYGNFGQANYGAAKAGVVGLMNVLHLEGARHGIHVNALVPTAATRMTAEMFDAETLQALDPAYVTPAALFLVSDAAPSRTALLAGAGTYARLAIVESEGLYFPEAERTPENIAAHFDDIASLSRLVEPAEGLAHVARILKRAQEGA